MNDAFDPGNRNGPLSELLEDHSHVPPQQDDPPFTRHPETPSPSPSPSTTHATATPSLPPSEPQIPVTAEPDFALDDLDPADLDSEQAESVLWAGDLQVLAEHHAPDRSRSYVVAHDTSVTWGVPGEPQLAAITITRDLDRRTFTLESAYHAALPFAQAWLVERGCPPERITVPDGMFIEPADDLTLRIEQKIREAVQRYDVLDTFTRDYDPYESWTLVRDTLAAQNPVRVFLEQGNPEAFTYTVREGAFPDEDTARDWLDDRDGPLPQAPEDHIGTEALRARVALARSTGRAGSLTACGLDRNAAPSAGTAQRPGAGRSL